MYAKYRAKKVVVDGITFMSQKEAKRYKELKELESSGKIKNLQLQCPYLLIPKQTISEPRVSKKTGKRLKDKEIVLERKCEYVADFVYDDDAGNHVVEDAKGVKTKEYIIKRKLMLYVHGIKIFET